MLEKIKNRINPTKAHIKSNKLEQPTVVKRGILAFSFLNCPNNKARKTRTVTNKQNPQINMRIA